MKFVIDIDMTPGEFSAYSVEHRRRLSAAFKRAKPVIQAARVGGSGTFESLYFKDEKGERIKWTGIYLRPE